MSTNPIPDGLRDAIERGLAPVRPLPPAWQRALGVAVIATATVSVTLATSALRFDIHLIPAWRSWGSSLVELTDFVVRDAHGVQSPCGWCSGRSRCARRSLGLSAASGPP